MNWFTVTHRPGFALVSITNEIGTHSQTAQDFAAELGSASRVELMLDSCGGDGHAGMELFRILSERDTVATVTRRCHSAAMLVLMSAKRIEALAGSTFLLHPPTVWACSNAAQLRAAADGLDDLTGKFASIVSQRTRQPLATVQQWLAGETWFSAEEALRFGLVDSIVSPPSLAERTEPAPPVTATAQEQGPTQDEVFALDMLRLTTGLHVRNRQRFAQAVAMWLQNTKEI